MSIRIARLLLIGALMISIGAQWAVLQSAAWVSMAVSYSIKSSSVKEGLTQTFDGKHPCPMCLAIAKGKDAGKKSPAEGASKQKLNLLASGEKIFSFDAQDTTSFAVSANEAAAARLVTPPLPPPRCSSAQA